jgi:hypothetical protein
MGPSGEENNSIFECVFVIGRKPEKILKIFDFSIEI